MIGRGMVCVCVDARPATSCISIDCPYFFERCRALRTTQHMFAVLRQTGMLHREPVAAVVVVDDDIIDLQDD